MLKLAKGPVLVFNEISIFEDKVANGYGEQNSVVIYTA
jgi:hypothetical protein